MSLSSAYAIKKCDVIMIYTYMDKKCLLSCANVEKNDFMLDKERERGRFRIKICRFLVNLNTRVFYLKREGQLLAFRIFKITSRVSLTDIQAALLRSLFLEYR